MSFKDMIKRGGGPTGTRLVLYADTKAGKTTTASQAPAPLFIGTDDGFRRLPVDGLDSPKTWPEFLDQLNMACSDGPGEGYKTLVIDTINGVADLCAQWVCDQHFGGKWADSKNGFLAWGGHQGWAAVSEEMKQMIPLLDGLVDQGFWVILLAHQKVEKVSDPIEGEYDRYSPALHRNVWPRFGAWADAVLRISFDAVVDKEDRHVTCDGTRILKCAATSAEVAGTRAGYELPPTMTLAWANIEERMGDVDDDLVDRVMVLVRNMNEEDTKKALSYLGVEELTKLQDAPPHKLKALAGRLEEKAHE